MYIKCYLAIHHLGKPTSTSSHVYRIRTITTNTTKNHIHITYILLPQALLVRVVVGIRSSGIATCYWRPCMTTIYRTSRRTLVRVGVYTILYVCACIVSVLSISMFIYYAIMFTHMTLCSIICHNTCHVYMISKYYAYNTNISIYSISILLCIPAPLGSPRSSRNRSRSVVADVVIWRGSIEVPPESIQMGLTKV